ncbi:MAG: peptidoglycan DD-metalloendopeptidase family protein [Campylobacterota bacterium]|nr:peptidoglycan DD-metalloendopeptidase family protein [Campylobacterota bacterium]
MYKKLFLSFILLQSLLLSQDLEQSIFLLKQQKDKSNKLEILAKEIKYQEKIHKDIKQNLIETNENIIVNIAKLKQFKLDILRLKDKLKQIKKDIALTEKRIVDEMTNRYSASLGLSLAKKATSDEIIDKEIYSLLMKFTKTNIKKLHKLYEELNQSDTTNRLKILKYNKFIKDQENKKTQYNKIVKRKETIINKLNQDHEKYKKELEDIIAKQKEIGVILEDLDIVEKNKTLQNIDNQNENMNDIDIVNYKGYKTIPPLKSYTIIKKFGRFTDEIYNKTIFNKSISMKQLKLNSEVYNVLNGKVIYIKKDSSVLENIVVIEHKDKVHTIYSNIDSINYSLSIGQRVRKGTSIGMLNDTLIFQVTQENRYINPEELFE